MASDTIKVKLVGDSKSLEKAFKNSQTSGKKWGASFGAISKTAVLGLGAVAVAAGAAGYKMLTLASDAAEVDSKLKVVFGKALPGLTKNLDAFAEATGASRYELRQQAADMGALLRPLSENAQAAANMSEKTVKLATDLGSFNNVPVADALLAIRSGLVGESEPLRRFGVLLNEAAVNAEGVRLGLIKSGGTMTEQQKVQARYSLILKQTKLAQGDATRTAGSMANQMKALKNNVTDLATDLGKKLIPIALQVTKALNKFLDWAEKNWPKFQQAITDGINKIRPHFESLVDYWTGTLLPTIQSVVELARSFWGKFGEDIRRVFGSLVDIVKTALSSVKAIIELVMAVLRGDWSAAWEAIKTIARNALHLLVTYVQLVGTNILHAARALGMAILNGIVDQAKKVPGLVGGLLRQVPGKIRDLISIAKNAAKDLGSGIKDGIIGAMAGLASAVGGLVRAAINAAIDAFNALSSFKVDPPGPGSFTVNFPDIPHVATGGHVARSGLAVIHKGEDVIPARGGNGSSGPGQFALVWAGPDFIRWMREQDRRSRLGGSLA